MKVKSTVHPLPITWEAHEGTMTLRLTDSPRRVLTENGEEWEYEEYTLTVPKREDPARTLLPHAAFWLRLAQQQEKDLLASRLRAQRDALLAASDWTQCADTPLSADAVHAWAAYRKQLRDLPLCDGFPYAVSLPTPPHAEVNEDA